MIDIESSATIHDAWTEVYVHVTAVQASMHNISILKDLLNFLMACAINVIESKSIHELCFRVKHEQILEKLEGKQREWRFFDLRYS